MTRSNVSAQPENRPPVGSAAVVQRGPMLVFIGALKIVQGFLLAAVAIGVLRLIDKSVGDEAAGWLYSHHVDMDSPWVNRLLDRLWLVNNHQLRTMSVASGIYAIITLIEGTGLCLRRQWGEYFTILVTGSFLPFEIYECLHHFTYVKLAILLINAAVLVYLIVRVRNDRVIDDRVG